VLAIMGSGETAPTMVRLHRHLLARAGAGPALVLDTPYGFQENAADITARTLRYLRESTGREAAAVSWPRAEPARAAAALAALRSASWLLAGPGSPTYALGVWQAAGFGAEVESFVRRGGVAVFSSAAALTLGSRAVPVYEIYKCGIAPHWQPGLDVLGRLIGLSAALVPHFDNAEGGTHDTRYCYLGERRLTVLEGELDPGEHVLGVDEHTALLLDLAAGRATVWGNGVVTIRQHGHQAHLPADTVLDLTELVEMLRTHGAALAGSPPLHAPRPTASSDAPVTEVSSSDAAGASASLAGAAAAAERAFAAAMAARDAPGAVAAALQLERALEAWVADPTQSGEREHARRTLQTMVVRLAEVGVPDDAAHRATVAGFVDLLLQVRADARARADWAGADAIRDGLAELGVWVRDEPAATQWGLATDGGQR